MSNNIGTTLLPSGMNSPAGDIDNLQTKKFVMAGNAVDGISISETETSPQKLATAYTLHAAKVKLEQSLDNLKYAIDNITLSSVLSKPLASPLFLDLSLWDLNGFTPDNGKLIYINRTPPEIGQAYARLNETVFLNPGPHYLDLIVTELPVGSKLTILDNAGHIIGVVDGAGRQRFLFTVEHPGTFYLDIRVDDMPLGTQLILDYAGVHSVRPDFEGYLEFKIAELSSGGTGFVTGKELNDAIAALRQSTIEYVDAADKVLSRTISEHTTDTTGNPHNITPSLIAAAEKKHKHAAEDIADYVEQIQRPIAAVVAELVNMQNQLTGHLHANNPHGLTIVDLNGAPREHEHAIEDVITLSSELSALKADIEMLRNAQGSEISEQIDRLNTDLGKTAGMLRTHELATGNVHSAVPFDFGIEFATSAEAQGGVNQTKYMNPEVTKAAVQSWSTWKDTDVTRLQPRNFGAFKLTKAEPQISFEISATGLYQIVFNGNINFDMRKLRLNTNGTFNNASKIVTSTSIDRANKVNETHTGLKFLAATVGTNVVFGTWTFQPSQSILFGEGVGYTGTASGSNVTIASGHVAVSSISAHELPGITTNATRMTLTLDDPVDASEITGTIYELVSVQEHAIAIDAHPAGTIVEFFGNQPKKDYSLFDGSELNRGTFAKLYAVALASGALLSKAEWTAQVTAYGYCNRFHTGDGSTTFGLPKLDTSGPVNKYIKLKDTFLAEPGQVFFEYTWED